jgi:hypothetical protein
MPSSRRAPICICSTRYQEGAKTDPHLANLRTGVPRWGPALLPRCCGYRAGRVLGDRIAPGGDRESWRSSSDCGAGRPLLRPSIRTRLLQAPAGGEYDWSDRPSDTSMTRKRARWIADA